MCKMPKLLEFQLIKCIFKWGGTEIDTMVAESHISTMYIVQHLTIQEITNKTDQYTVTVPVLILNQIYFTRTK
jgi:hypothetical protein